MKASAVVVVLIALSASALKQLLPRTTFHHVMPRNPSLFALHRRQLPQSSVRHNMFSGIVEEMGIVDDINFTSEMKMWDGSIGEGVELTIKSAVAVEEAYIGCSIAVNGVCLTATSYDTHKVMQHPLVCAACLCWSSLLSLSSVSGAVYSRIGARNVAEVKPGLVEGR